MSEPKRIPCRCLLKDSAPAMAASVREYISLLEEDQRAPEPVYRERLAACLSCESLRDGTCALCGCYVEARAAKRRQRCPAVPPRWMEME